MIRVGRVDARNNMEAAFPKYKKIDAYPRPKLGILDHNIKARKEIYVPEFCFEFSKNRKRIRGLRVLLKRGINVLIMDPYGPCQESMDYYKTNYPVGDDFIQEGTIAITRENIHIMLNDPAHPFCYGYCMAMVILGVSKNKYWLR